MTTQQSLCDELEAYCKAQGLPFMSADELALRPGVTTEQARWLSEFGARWDAYMESDEARCVPLRTALELAGAFVTVLREMIPADAFAQCLAGRIQPDDVADSNVVLATAFLRLHRRAPWLPSDFEQGRCTEEEVERERHLWNDAVRVLSENLGRGQ